MIFRWWMIVNIGASLLANSRGVFEKEQLAWIVVEHTFRWLRCPDWHLFVRYSSGEERTGAAGQLGTLLFKNWSITASSGRVRRGSCSQETPGIRMRVDTDIAGFIKSTSPLLVIRLLKIVGVFRVVRVVARNTVLITFQMKHSSVTTEIKYNSYKTYFFLFFIKPTSLQIFNVKIIITKGDSFMIIENKF